MTTIPRKLHNQRNVLRERKSTFGRTPELASRADKAEAESKTVEKKKKTPNRSHDLREDQQSRGETQAKSQELENFAERHEPKKVSGNGCIGKSRYTSFRMMYLAHKSERFNNGRHDPKAFLI